MKKIIGLMGISLCCAAAFAGCGIHVKTGGLGDGTSVNVDIPFIHVETGDTTEEQVSGTVPDVPLSTAVTSFAARTEMGDIMITPSDDESIKVDYKVKVTGSDADKCKEIADKIEAAVDVGVNKAELKLSVAGDNNIEKYLTKMYGINYKAKIDVNVQLPKSITMISIENAMGDLKIEDFEGTVDIKSAMGDVDLDGVTFAGNSTINCAMGDIDVTLTDVLSESAELGIENAMGDIKVYASSLSVNTTKSEKAMLSGSLEAVVGGTLNISAETAMGDVAIR